MTGREAAWMCVSCGYVCDAYTSFSDPKARPKTGDVSLCMNCGAEYVRHAGRWRPMTAAEREAMHPESRRQIEEMHAARSHVPMPDLAKRGGRA